MTDTDAPEPFALSADRVQQIRDLVTGLNAPQAFHPASLTPAEANAATAQLLHACHEALRDLLADRDALVKAHSEAADELALWIGSV